VVFFINFEEFTSGFRLQRSGFLALRDLRWLYGLAVPVIVVILLFIRKLIDGSRNMRLGNEL
jgi:tetrahydromethanopterin S-methyltransferase subunit G